MMMIMMTYYSAYGDDDDDWKFWSRDDGWVVPIVHFAIIPFRVTQNGGLHFYSNSLIISQSDIKTLL